MNAYLMTRKEVLSELETDADVGLTDAKAEESAGKNGRNEFSKEKPISLGRRIWESASEPMIIMLILAGVIATAVNTTLFVTGGEADFLECVGIFAAISLSVIITVIMEGKSAKAFEALSKINEDVQVRLIRNGETRLIPQKDVVVGDIICIETGDKMPADGRLLESTALKADESSLTGESVPVSKQAEVICELENTPVAERKNMLYSGSFITGGSGKMAVTAVGDRTEFGKIAKELSATDKSTTPLQEKLGKLGKRITMMGATAAAIVFLIQAGIYLSSGTATLANIAEAFITSIVLIVAAVPEGLPTIVAVSLAVNIIKMSKQNALVKKMIACETVGCINVICSDKTGTLTENKMTVVEVYERGTLCQPEEVCSEAMLRNFCLNGTADVNFHEDGPQFIGNPTECALLVAARKAGTVYRELRERETPIFVFPFSSETKNMTSIFKEEAGLTAYTKGSPENILAMCRVSMDERREIETLIGRFQEKSCRMIAFAHKEMKGKPWEPQLTDEANGDRCAECGQAEVFGENRREIEQGMVFDGFVAITDPLRCDVFESVEHCRRAGIDLKMLTGDNIVTATAIAEELKLLEGECIAVEAKELEHLTDEELTEMLPKIRVIARSTPVVKMRVVNALKASGNVVAVTGDGINDAPAIKNADVGVAMGISGTEVSKEASDIVLLDDSFSTIVKAVQWGRGIYENFQRFIQFQLTVNLSSVIVVLCSILMGFHSPFSALELLWINIIMDGPPALTLGLEPIREDLLNRRPTRRDASIVDRPMLNRIFINGIFISVVFMCQHVFNFLGSAPQQDATVLFTLFVLFQLFNAFNSRELSDTSLFANIRSNKLMLLVVGVTFSLQILITQFGGAFFGTVPLPLSMWMKMIGTAFSVIVLGELVKWFRRRKQ